MGLASDLWSVGDTKDIIAGSETLTMEIVGFNHDKLANSAKTAAISLGMKNLTASTRIVDSSGSNVGGFTKTDLHEWLNGDLYDSLADDLKAVIKSVIKPTSAGGASSAIESKTMKIWAFSATEIGSDENSSVPKNEGTQYSRFTNAASRIKYINNGAGDDGFWYLRSANVKTSKDFCYVSGSGNVTIDGETGAGYVCFGFCI